MTNRILIVGAGQAGGALAVKLRAEGCTDPITLLGDEAVAPYQRPPLSKKYLLGEMEKERLLLKPETWYAENDIELRTSEYCNSIDTAARTVRLNSGESIEYARLALTTGAHPNHLPAAIGGNLQRIYTMRDIADADALSGEFEAGRHVLIVGGGYIGLEAAAVARQRGLKVTLIELSDRILKRVACAQTADYFRDLHTDHGVDILEGMALARLEGDNGSVNAALLSDGSRLAIDFVIIGIGVSPNIGIAESAGITIDNGIAVDQYCRTSAPHVYAAGDCASFERQGERIRLESVQNAMDQARVAAMNMLGHETPYAPEIRFWSDQYDVKLQIAGLAHNYDAIVSRAGRKPGSLAVFYYAGDQLQAVDAINDPMTYVMTKKMIDAGINLPRELAQDPDYDLKQHLTFR